ncbi:MAG TPA: hypothetical protein VHT30_01525 [Acidimicrobiales bacterium]|jgi:hypothetical protein|nr:hypothetical protein [Acidimicrobiales bacterium]
MIIGQTGPLSIGDWSDAVVNFFTSYAPDIGLAILAIAAATVVLALGNALVCRVWSFLAGLGDEAGYQQVLRTMNGQGRVYNPDYGADLTKIPIREFDPDGDFDP